MGKAYSEESRDQVKLLLQQEVAEDEIEKRTGVSDRTIRRWKLELERYGRIGKPPESRTGRHRVMNKDVEQALFNHVAQKPDLSVDDMLWWLYDTYKLVVGTRTIRRAFERRNTSHKKFRNDARKDMKASKDSNAATSSIANDGDSPGDQTMEDDETDVQIHHPLPDQLANQSAGQAQAPNMAQSMNTYQSPYAPMAPMTNNAGPSDISPELARALGGLTQAGDANIHPDLVDDNDDDDDMELSEDEETLQLQLEQIALQRRELELKLKMRKLKRARRSSQTPRMSTDVNDQSFMTDLDADPGAAGPDDTDSVQPGAAQASAGTSPPNKHRDSRSKSKVEEAKKRTEERQERMLKDLERRSRRREHLTAEWVQSRDVWAKGPEKLLISLMHQNSTYAYNQNSLDTFETIFRSLYQLVDHTDWYPPVHDDLLRERTRRKMSQLRSKMVKSGEIVSRGEGYGGWTRPNTSIDDSLPLDQQAVQQQDLQQDMQHSLQAMSNLPLDMALGGGADARHQPSEEAMMARDAMMHAPHHQGMLEHQPFQHPHSHDPQAYGQDIHAQEMHEQDFGQHHPDLAPQNAMHDPALSRQSAL